MVLDSVETQPRFMLGSLLRMVTWVVVAAIFNINLTLWCYTLKGEGRWPITRN